MEELEYKIVDKKIIFTKCPKVLERSMINKALMDAFNSNFDSHIVEICEGVEVIGDSAFFSKSNIKKIHLPNSLKEIGEDAFTSSGLKEIVIPNNVVKIGCESFRNCYLLEKVELSNNLIELGEGAFVNCNSLKEITIPDNVESIASRMFYGCTNLIKVKLPNDLKKIGPMAFYECISLKYIDIPEKVKRIEENAFLRCLKLESVEFPDSLIEIGFSAFANCSNLKNIVFSNSIKFIGSRCFEACSSLEKVKLPKNITQISSKLFSRCLSLREIEMNENLKRIDSRAFEYCENLESVDIPFSVEFIESEIFFLCTNLKNIYLPSNLNHFDYRAIDACRNLDKIFIKLKDRVVEKKAYYIECLYNDSYKLYMYDNDKCLYSFCNDGEYVEFKPNLIFNDKNFRYWQLDANDEVDYIIFYYWTNKKFIPSYTIMKLMPLNYVNNFYINNNCKVWEQLVEKCNFLMDSNIGSFFKLCFVLGLFNNSVKIRDRAVKFIENNIIGKMDEIEIHSKFDGFDLSNGYNEEYARFFIKYYNSEDFMIEEDFDGGKIDLISSSYNNFKEVKEIYPNKVVNTNRREDMLLPIHVINAILNVKYFNIDEGNEELSNIVGRYGYTQEQFEEIQRLFNEGKSIKYEDMKLFISNDDEGSEIRYELLDKNNPLGAVLGNITNCCQVIGGQGESCVRYGITKPNSKFMTFNYNYSIIGQSWVWYDETSKTICLDNIEVPQRFINLIDKKEDLQGEFVKCLLRMANNFKEKMNRYELEVDKVTIGKGYNDINDILEKYFKLDTKPNELSDYNGYSDAENQYEIINNIK